MNDYVCLDNKYSTTKLLVKEKPILEQRPECNLEQKLFWSEEENRQGEGGLRIKGYFKKSFSNKPLMSIVTVVYNGEKYLEQTINSVLEQNYDNLEYIIIDGGSTDKTLDIIKKYEEKIDYWISESDQGIYDAMNKGSSLATGVYVSFLNADDWYLEDSINSVVKSALDTNSGYIFGDMNVYDGDDFISKRIPTLSRYKRGTPIGHQALFVQTKYLQQMPFDTRYKIIADYDFMIKLMKADISCTQLNRSLVNFRADGLSSVTDYRNDKFHIHYNHFGILTAIYGYILGTKHPLISRLIQTLVRIKHFIKEFR